MPRLSLRVNSSAKVSSKSARRPLSCRSASTRNAQVDLDRGEQYLAPTEQHLLCCTSVQSLRFLSPQARVAGCPAREKCAPREYRRLTYMNSVPESLYSVLVPFDTPNLWPKMIERFSSLSRDLFYRKDCIGRLVHRSPRYWHQERLLHKTKRGIRWTLLEKP